jgi:hypothetical protein
MAQTFIENSCSHQWKFCAEPTLIFGEFLTFGLWLNRFSFFVENHRTLLSVQYKIW